MTGHPPACSSVAHFDRRAREAGTLRLPVAPLTGCAGLLMQTKPDAAVAELLRSGVLLRRLADACPHPLGGAGLGGAADVHDGDRALRALAEDDVEAALA